MDRLERLEERLAALEALTARDHNIAFKYLSGGIELHPRVKRESDALVSDFEDASPDARMRYQLASERVPDGAAVLDLSCGYGYGSEFLARSGRDRKVVGADSFPPAIRFARRVFGRASTDVDYLCRNGLDEQAFPEGRFDVVVSLETIEHVEDDRAIMTNFRRWLRQDGMLIVSVPNQDRKPFDPVRHPYHHRHYSTETIRSLAAQAGFQVAESFLFDWRGHHLQDGENLFAVLRPATAR